MNHNFIRQLAERELDYQNEVGQPDRSRVSLAKALLWAAGEIASLEADKARLMDAGKQLAGKAGAVAEAVHAIDHKETET